jgi:hypothetical protein
MIKPPRWIDGRAFYLLSNFSRKQKPSNGASWAATRDLPGVKKNVVGRFSIDGEGNCQFTYRPYLVLKTRKITLNSQDLALKRALISLVLTEGAEGPGRELLALPAAYSGALSEKYTTVSVERQKLGFGGGVSWFKDQFESRAESG